MALFLRTATLFASPIVFDRCQSPDSFSNSFISVQNQLLDWQNFYKGPDYNKLEIQEFSELCSLKHSYKHFFQQESLGKNILKSTLRAGELLAIWNPINYMAAIVQHEVFGHGYRVRSFGPRLAFVVNYKLRFKIDKYGFHVSEAYTRSYVRRRLSFFEEAALSIAGLEANSIFANNLLFSWLEKGSIDGRQATLWRHNQFATLRYIRTLRNSNGKDFLQLGKVSHDIISYYNAIHCSYLAWDWNDHLQELRIKSLTAYLLNPFTYLSYLSELYYVLSNAPIPIFGIPGKGCAFLPAYKIGLTPFGLEDIYEFYIWGKSISPTLIYYKKGKFARYEYGGGGFENRKIIRTKYGSLGLKLDYWRQPPVIFHEEKGDWISRNLNLPKTVFGGACSLIYQKSVFDKIDAWAQFGAKTKGFLPGESLKAVPIIKLGFASRF